MANDVISQLHNKLLESMPDGANHPEDCPICNAGDGAELHPGGVMSTFTQEELDAAVEAAITALKSEVADLQRKLEKSDAEDAFASEKAELETQIAELQVKLDAAVLEATAAKTEYAGLVSYLEAQVSEQAEEEARKQKKADRIAKMRAYAFTDEQVEERADRWAAMDDEQFESYLADLEAIGNKKSEDDSSKDEASDSKIPADTAMNNKSEKKMDGKAAMREVLSLKSRGIDPATVPTKIR